MGRHQGCAAALCEALESRLLMDGTLLASGWFADAAHGDRNAIVASAAADGGVVKTASRQVSAFIHRPGTPAQLLADSPTGTDIDLTWEQGAGDAPDGYLITRRDWRGRWITIGDVDGSVTSFTDTHVMAGQQYAYSVAAYNWAGYSGYSDTTTFVIPLVSDPSQIGEFETFPGGPRVAYLNFFESDGTDVQIVLRGAGHGVLQLTVDGYLLTLTGTIGASTVDIKTWQTDTVGDDGRFMLTDFVAGDWTDPQDDTRLGELYAPTTDLAGNVVVTGAAGLVLMGDLLGGNVLNIGGAGTWGYNGVDLDFESVHDTSILATGGIDDLAVTEWLDTDGDADVIEAPFMDTLNAYGSRWRSMAGDFEASMTLTGDGFDPDSLLLWSASIAGSVGPVVWDVSGRIGSVRVYGDVGTNADAFVIQNTTYIGSLSFADVQNASILANGALGTITAQRWLAGDISATSALSLRTTGQGFGGFIGDFGANVTLTGDSRRLTLGSASIGGYITGGAWDIAGSAGAVSARGIDSPWAGRFDGNLASLTLSSASATSTLDLEAMAIGRITINGSISGSRIVATLLPDRFKKAIGAVTISGVMQSSEIRAAGNIGTVRIWGIGDSVVFAGVDDAVTGLPTSAADFVEPTATIDSLTITGRFTGTPLFVASHMAAGTIKNARLPSTSAGVLEDGGEPFGFATLSGVIRYFGPVSTGFFVSGYDSVVA